MTLRGARALEDAERRWLDYAWRIVNCHPVEARRTAVTLDSGSAVTVEGPKTTATLSPGGRARARRPRRRRSDDDPSEVPCAS